MNFGGPETFVVRVVGASMEPWFRDGEFAYVDPDEPAVYRRFVAFREPGSDTTRIRQLVVSDGRRVLRASAPGWPECVVDADNETMILGEVVFAGRAV